MLTGRFYIATACSLTQIMIKSALHTGINVMICQGFIISITSGVDCLG